MTSWSVTARWVVPVAGPPLEHGVVVIHGERIAAVEARGRRSPDRDLGDVALLPGLVNAHTHLDLSGLNGLAPPSADFTGWLRAVVGHRRRLTPEQVLTDIRTGLAQSLHYGTTLLGDISAFGLSWPVLAESATRAVVFYELLGLPPDRAAVAHAAARAWLNEHPATATCRPGLSPHAPYSVRSSLFTASAELARRRHAPLATHLAETPAEMELLQRHAGPFVPFLTDLGVWDPAGLAANVDDVIARCAGVPTLFVHGNYLDAAGPIPSDASIVYCPRTHAAFGHAPHPFRQMLARGLRVAIGTDSLASNPDLDVLAEIRFLHHICPDVPGDLLLRLATLHGAEALGCDDATGSLTPGKSADLVVLPLPPLDVPDPYRLVLESTTPVSGVLCRGRWIIEA